MLAVYAANSACLAVISARFSPAVTGVVDTTAWKITATAASLIPFKRLFLLMCFCLCHHACMCVGMYDGVNVSRLAPCSTGPSDGSVCFFGDLDGPSVVSACVSVTRLLVCSRHTYAKSIAGLIGPFGVHIACTVCMSFSYDGVSPLLQ